MRYVHELTLGVPLGSRCDGRSEARVRIGGAVTACTADTDVVVRSGSAAPVHSRVWRKRVGVGWHGGVCVGGVCPVSIVSSRVRGDVEVWVVRVSWGL